MRCKRCGGILNPGETRCPVCGKTPPQVRQRPAAPKTTENNIKLPQLERFTRTYQKDVSKSRLLQTVTIVAVAAAIVLLALVYSGLGDLNDAVTQLQENAQQVQQPQQTPDPVPEETTGTEPTEQTAQTGALSAQNVEAALTLSRSGSGTYVNAGMTPGNSDDRALVWISTGEAHPERQFKVSWVMEKSGDRLDAELIDRHSGAEGSYSVSLTWKNSGTTFGSYSNPMCIWEYRIDDGQWSSVNAEAITAAPGSCEVRLSAEDLTGLMGEGKVMEVRCNLSMSHPDGGSLKLAVTGISLNGAGLTANGALAD